MTDKIDLNLVFWVSITEAFDLLLKLFSTDESKNDHFIQSAMFPL